MRITLFTLQGFKDTLVNNIVLLGMFFTYIIIAVKFLGKTFEL